MSHNRAPLQNILCATDFSETSTRALDVAIDVARTFDARLWLVHVIDPALLFGAELTAARMVEHARAAQRDLAESGLLRALARSASAGISARSQVELGDPASVLIELSSEADLLVLGTDARTALARVRLGSVAERVLRAATCPVLVVPSVPPKRDASSTHPLAPT